MVTFIFCGLVVEITYTKYPSSLCVEVNSCLLKTKNPTTPKQPNRRFI